VYKFGNFQRERLSWGYNKTEFVNSRSIVTQICGNLYLFMKLKNFSIIFRFHLAEIKNTFLLAIFMVHVFKEMQIQRDDRKIENSTKLKAVKD